MCFFFGRGFMDKLTYFNVFDCNGDCELSFRICVRGFPVVELLEFDVDGVWSRDVSGLEGVISADFKSRLLSFLDDDNMRIILDIMGNGDVFVSRKYSLKVVVDYLELL